MGFFLDGRSHVEPSVRNTIYSIFLRVAAYIYDGCVYVDFVKDLLFLPAHGLRVAIASRQVKIFPIYQWYHSPVISELYAARGMLFFGLSSV